MKNKELIEKLKEFNLEADVTTPFSEDICIGYIDDDEKYNEKTTPIVFIEPCDYIEL